jgi:hypothetical protein
MALIKALHSDNFFGHCARAFQLTVGMFAPGGAIQTVLDLYYWLQPCQMAAMTDVKFASFLQPNAAVSESKKKKAKNPRGSKAAATKGSGE